MKQTERIAGAPRALRTWLALPTAVMILWAGSFEVDRYFAPGRSVGWANREQAMQMTYSLWWASYAAAILALGMIRSHRPLRYLAIALFAVTIGKVLLVDMRDVEAVYRILSFLGLGVLLVAASWLYYRYFRAAAENG